MKVINNMEKDEKDYSPYCPHCTACGSDGCCSATMCSPDHPECQYGRTYLEDLRQEEEYLFFALLKLRENDFFGYKDAFEKIYDNYVKASKKADEWGKLRVAYRASHVLFNLLDEFDYFEKGSDYFLTGMTKIKFQFYINDISKPTPVGWVSLQQFIDSIKSPKPEIQELFQNIEKAASSGDLKLKDKLKSKLFYFTPCVKMDGLGRGYSNIESFTELLVLDFDKIDNAPAFKDFLFEAMPQIICAYLSPSRKGVKFLVRIPKCEGVEDFKSYFYGIAYYLEKYRGFDPTTQNCVLPLYLSWDAEIRTRPFEQTAVWTRRGMKLQECKKRDPREPVLEAENINEESRKGIQSIVSRMMGSIVDAGHPVVRSSALLLGGYVGSGYFSQNEAEDIMDSLIDESDYCKKNPNGYKKTAQQMIVRGMDSPLYFDNE